MRKIQDYLTYYMNATYMAIPQHALDRKPVEARIRTWYSDGTEIEMIEEDAGKDWPAWFTFYADIKPILRPLSDMTEEERKELWLWMFNRPFHENGRTVFIDKETAYNDPRWVMSSGVERLGIEMNGTVWADSDMIVWKHNQHEATKWFLSKGFDLFNLIPDGLAINKTTL